MPANDVQVGEIFRDLVDPARVRVIDVLAPPEAGGLQEQRDAEFLDPGIKRIQARVGGIWCVQRVAARFYGYRAQVKFAHTSLKFGHGVVHRIADVDPADADEAARKTPLHVGLGIIGRGARRNGFATQRQAGIVARDELLWRHAAIRSLRNFMCPTFGWARRHPERSL